ncbi:MAG: GTPase [Candidatus Eisenbacteria bacterium]
MPANLTPEYLRLDAKLHEAKDPQEKLTILREMLAVIPKHKGTDRLQGDLKRRISKLEEVTQQKAKRGTRDIFHVSREGIAQVLLAGSPNSGKSSLLAGLTNATPLIGDYPFTTQQPYPGMLHFEDVQIQLIDMPPLSRDFSEAGFYNAYRICDMILIVVDLDAADPSRDLQEDLALFDEHLIKIVPHSVDRRPGSLSTVEKQGLILANKADLAGPAALERVAEGAGSGFRVLACAADGQGLDELPRLLFAELKLVRVYTKKPGKRFEKDAPFVMPAGSTVIDVARAIHKDIAENLKFVRLWGSGKHEGISAPRDHVIADGDILEIHAR